jgi:hypothetical protein
MEDAMRNLILCLLLAVVSAFGCAVESGPTLDEAAMAVESGGGEEPSDLRCYFYDDGGSTCCYRDFSGCVYCDPSGACTPTGY